MEATYRKQIKNLTLKITNEKNEFWANAMREVRAAVLQKLHQLQDMSCTDEG